MSTIDHILLYCLFFIVLLIFSAKSNKRKTSSNFWNSAILTILFFIIIEGCRYGRGADYLSYKYRFEHLDIFEPQKLYLAINQLLHFVGTNYIGAFMFYALIFIIGTFYFIRKSFDREEARWMYCLAIVSMLFKFETFPKQYLALPFILCSIPFMYKKNKWIVAVLLIVSGLNIHSGLTFLVLVLIASYFFIKKTLPAKYLIFLLFVVYYVLPPGFLADFFISILKSFHLGSLLASDHVTLYVDNADRWLGADSFIETTQQSFFTKTLQFLFEIAVILSTSIALRLKPNHKILFLFNITMVGFIFYRMFHGFEIFARLFGQLNIFWFVPLGYAIYILKNFNFSYKQKQLMKLTIGYAILYQIMLYIRFIFLNPEATYVWNI